MSDPTKCYAVSSGTYSDYEVHAIYRRREDAEARARSNNSAEPHLLDGEPASYAECLEAWESVVDSSEVLRVEREKYERTTNYELRKPYNDLSSSWWRQHVDHNPAREDCDDMRVEEFDYYEGEPLPAQLQEPR